MQACDGIVSPGVVNRALFFGGTLNNYNVALTRSSDNKKTGPIPVSTSEKSTCPSTCKMYDNCYGKYGPIAIHWDMISDKKRGIDWHDFCVHIQRLPNDQLWRHNQAGDLPGDGTHIDMAALGKLVHANLGKRGFTYTHYDMNISHNKSSIEYCNKHGFTINVSCDTLEQVDEMAKLTTAPMVVVLKSDEERTSFFTPGGKRVLVCPATRRQNVQCVNCELCQKQGDARPVIGFPAHGTKKKAINEFLSRQGE